MDHPAKRARSEPVNEDGNASEGPSEGSSEGSSEDGGEGGMGQMVRDALRVLGHYRAYARRVSDRHRRHGARLQASFTALMPAGEFDRQADTLAACAAANADFMEAVATHTRDTWWPAHMGEAFGDPEELPAAISAEDEQELKSVDAALAALAREWSNEGAAARKACFDPLVEALCRHFPGAKASTRVLVPGAGLARLGVDCAAAGFAVEANEIEIFFILMADFITLEGDSTKPWTVHPFVEQPCNQKSFANRTRAVRFPDTTPSKVDAGVEFATGDFVELYGGDGDADGEVDDWADVDGNASGSESGRGGGGGGDSSSPGAFDAVCSAFFVDTGPVVFEYLAALKRCLRPGGLWTNLGPLGYHFAIVNEDKSDERFDQAIELPWAELRLVIEASGFEFLEERWLPDTPYKSDTLSMEQTRFETIFFVARKKE